MSLPWMKTQTAYILAHRRNWTKTAPIPEPLALVELSALLAAGLLKHYSVNRLAGEWGWGCGRVRRTVARWVDARALEWLDDRPMWTPLAPRWFSEIAPPPPAAAEDDEQPMNFGVQSSRTTVAELSPADTSGGEQPVNNGRTTGEPSRASSPKEKDRDRDRDPLPPTPLRGADPLPEVIDAEIIEEAAAPEPLAAAPVEALEAEVVDETPAEAVIEPVVEVIDAEVPLTAWAKAAVKPPALSRRDLQDTVIAALEAATVSEVKPARCATDAGHVLGIWRALGWYDPAEFLADLQLVARAAHECPHKLFARDIRAEGWDRGTDRRYHVATLCRRGKWGDRLREAKRWAADGFPAAMAGARRGGTRQQAAADACDLIDQMLGGSPAEPSAPAIHVRRIS